MNLVPLLKFKWKRHFGCINIFILLLASVHCSAQNTGPDTVKVGIYITSIHDIDFKQKEFTATFWLWLRYKNLELDFDRYLEIPQAKTVNKSFSSTTIDSTLGTPEAYVLLKIQCVMKDSWRIENFPFDVQKLRISVENSQFDSSALVFVPDTLGENYDKRFTLRGWTIDSCLLSVGIKTYETSFGLDSTTKPISKYSAFRVRLSMHREAMGIFWKLFLGMYIAFLIAFICFFIHHDSMDSRFGLSVGSLFAVIGNKYIIDSSLPETTSFTLVDTLHGLTLFFIFIVIAATTYSLKLSKTHRGEKGDRFDNRMAVAMGLLYIILNIWFIYRANES